MSGRDFGPSAQQRHDMPDSPTRFMDVEPGAQRRRVHAGLLVDHNATSKRPMNLAIFLYAVEHISRICRVLKQPGGHMLNVGLGGSGRQSLTCLSAYICGMDTFQVRK
jgi:hypothetical protein